MIQKGYITVREASARSGLSRDHISLLLRRGIIMGFKIERDWLIEEGSFETYMASRPKPGPKKA